MTLARALRRFSLRAKFVLPISIVMCVSVFVISTYLIRQQADGFHREFEENGQTLARLVARQAESGVLFEDKEELNSILEQLTVINDVRYAVIIDNEGKILAEVGAWPVTNKETQEPIHIAADRSSMQYMQFDKNPSCIQFECPIVTIQETLNPENLGTTGRIDSSMTRSSSEQQIGTLRVLWSLEQVEHAIAKSTRTAVILTVLILLLTIVILALIVRAVVEPVKRLVEATDRVTCGNYAQKVEVVHEDEIGQLALTFNEMIESLRQSREAIEEYNRTLEQRIQERTRALEEAQAQLTQSEKMNAIGQLSAGVAHELNNPLGGILGYAQFALEKLRKGNVINPDSPDAKNFVRYLSDIETQARRCKTIVQNLLRFARTSHTAEFEPVDINKAIEETRTFVEHQLNMHQIHLITDLDEHLPIVYGNISQLQQVFTNLIINAMHASPTDSSITIRTRHSQPVGEFVGTVEMQFIDQGCGIPAENMKKIFEPFFTTKEVGKGTGLGLSVSYGIIREHGGEIRVHSTVGVGTTFTIVLPLQKKGPSTDIDPRSFISAPIASKG
jgi:two-component system NtrC family sensor kinase